MALIVCRHGRTALNAKRVVQPSDTPLDEEGLAQAARLASRLASHSIERIFCSDLPRARMTAAAIEAQTGLTAELTSLLQERNFGDMRGTPYAQIDFDLWALDYIPPNGEGWDAFHERVDQAWAAVVERAQGLRGDLVVVTHGLVCHALVRRHATLGPGIELAPRWSNASVTIIEASAPHVVSLLDDTAHLDGDASTASL
jgi:probable phosphoglycerate mutase